MQTPILCYNIVPQKLISHKQCIKSILQLQNKICSPFYENHGFMVKLWTINHHDNKISFPTKHNSKNNNRNAMQEKLHYKYKAF